MVGDDGCDQTPQTEGRRPAPRSSLLGPPFSLLVLANGPSAIGSPPPPFIRMPCGCVCARSEPVDVSLTYCARWGSDGLIGGRAITRVVQHTRFRYSTKLIFRNRHHECIGRVLYIIMHHHHHHQHHRQHQHNNHNHPHRHQQQHQHHRHHHHHHQ
jgi:hypothetical protein